MAALSSGCSDHGGHGQGAETAEKEPGRQERNPEAHVLKLGPHHQRYHGNLPSSSQVPCISHQALSGRGRARASDQRDWGSPWLTADYGSLVKALRTLCYTDPCSPSACRSSPSFGHILGVSLYQYPSPQPHLLPRLITTVLPMDFKTTSEWSYRVITCAYSLFCRQPPVFLTSDYCEHCCTALAGVELIR